MRCQQCGTEITGWAMGADGYLHCPGCGMLYSPAAEPDPAQGSLYGAYGTPQAAGSFGAPQNMGGYGAVQSTGGYGASPYGGDAAFSYGPADTVAQPSPAGMAAQPGYGASSGSAWVQGGGTGLVLSPAFSRPPEPVQAGDPNQFANTNVWNTQSMNAGGWNAQPMNSGAWNAQPMNSGAWNAQPMNSGAWNAQPVNTAAPAMPQPAPVQPSPGYRQPAPAPAYTPGGTAPQHRREARARRRFPVWALILIIAGSVAVLAAVLVIVLTNTGGPDTPAKLLERASDAINRRDLNGYLDCTDPEYRALLREVLSLSEGGTTWDQFMETIYGSSVSYSEGVVSLQLIDTIGGASPDTLYIRYQISATVQGQARTTESYEALIRRNGKWYFSGTDDPYHIMQMFEEKYATAAQGEPY